MKIRIITDNTVYKPEVNSKLKKEWGFSSLIESEDFPSILFDTGASGEVLLNNIKVLGIDVQRIDCIFISHNHFDHTGGLESFLEQNKNVRLYVPGSYPSISEIKAKEIIRIHGLQEIYENVYSTGELSDIEQSLIVKTNKGVVVIVGCSHPGVEKILNTVSQVGKIYALIGGLHGFNKFEILKDLELICATHCTQHITEIQDLYPEKFVSGGAGRVIEILTA